MAFKPMTGPMTPLDLRRRALLVVCAALLAALAAAYLVAAPPTHVEDPVTLAALIAFGVIAMRCEASLPERLALGSLPGLSLVAVALDGPLAALLVLGVALTVPAVAGRERLLRAGNLSNLVSHAAYVLAAALTLRWLGHGPAGLAAAVVAQLAVNWLAGPALFVPLWLGRTLRDAAAVGLRGVPSGLIVGTLAALAVLATPVLGPAALATFAVVVLVPHATLAYLARRGSTARLGRGELTARYAGALALELGLDRAGRDRVDAVASAIARRRPTGSAVDYMVDTLADRTPASRDAGHLTEWVDGTGGPAGLSGGMIPLAARVVAVADSWAGLTAAGTAQLSHAEAVALLRAEAGQRLDPEIVAHVERLALGLPPTGEPGVHSRWLPTPVRRRLLAGLAPAPAPR